ncbi:hypothetical protein HZB58_00120 [Candidatus Gottesmanbacteria bacterium]|nr:hypothetical protein [Candidatus Gottesmanbacteria bacterium]
MKLQEKKYRVDSFSTVLNLLNQKGAKKIKDIVSTHYYGVHQGNDVEKLVEYPDRWEIHVFKETGGKFVNGEQVLVANKAAGLAWLKAKGYEKVNIIKMNYSEYGYKNGVIGLYIINDFLNSIILTYLPNQHKSMEKEFYLENTEIISKPYNKYLEKLNRVESVPLT